MVDAVEFTITVKHTGRVRRHRVMRPRIQRPSIILVVVSWRSRPLWGSCVCGLDYSEAVHPGSCEYLWLFFRDVMADPYSVALNTPQSAQLIDFSVSDRGSSSFFIYAG